MASAFITPRGWVADFRPMYGKANDGRQRIPPDRLLGPDDKAGATAYAEHLDRLCRLCEARPSAQIIAEAEEARAITGAQAAALRTASAIPPMRPLLDRRPTLLASAEAHPSSQRESENDKARHRRELEAFSAWSKVRLVEDLTLERVLAYLDHLKAQEAAYDSRRHVLLWLRRASKMAAAVGLPDPLSRMVLDRRERRGAIAVWSLPQLQEAARRLLRAPDQRPLAVLLLGAFCGLRDSEITRREVRDLQGDRLDVATDPAREAKNDASRRMIPLPPAVAAVLRKLCDGRDPLHPIIMTASNRTATAATCGRFADHSFYRWFRDAFWPDDERQAMGWQDSGLPRLPPKTMRKSFLSWAARSRVNRDLLERYTGHTISGVAAVTGRHYLADYAAEELEPVAQVAQDALAPVGLIYRKTSTST